MKVIGPVGNSGANFAGINVAAGAGIWNPAQNTGVTDNVMFGTEKPGTGSAPNPLTGRDYDDMKPVIESIDWLTDAQKADIFECNCRRVYSRAFRTDEQC